MRWIDFLIYHFTEYFTRNKRLLTWSTPLEKASYAIGLTSISWLLTAVGVFRFITTGSKEIPVNIFVAVAIVVGLLVNYVLEYVYIKKKRYEYVISNEYTSFNITYQKGIILSMLFLFGSIILPFAFAIIISFL